ncbi:hypothetical protein [Pseudobutyrivibrio xylanivorans]|uniref:DUF5648 domain-containing protein n=1 Tax=Pseudobutyrivibrio xylanivorans TaxID=185007 RepID=A0A5P6VM06_PSEXY|nr:hypothetical protein [Pseudobutyrivibrio xylanivorans]QFJ53695.1 hypothetical protein FXF36_01840 [Pseudobutyrivibrio xylanivorans]
MRVKMKRFLGIFLSIAMVLSLMPWMNLTVYAADEVKYLEGAWDETAGKCLLTEKSTDGYTVVTSSSTAWGGGTTYVVNSNVTIADRITVNGTANLILCDDATLTASSGITVSNGNTLNIFGQQEGTGTLTATAYYYSEGNNWDSKNYCGAAIGGLGYADSQSTGTEACGSINIHGGTVNANRNNNSECYAAGIGGAGQPYDEGYANGGVITVYYGTVNAYGSQGSGIGDYPSMYSNGGSFTMYGGIVTAVGGGFAGGISGGSAGSGTGVAAAIYGGMLTATGAQGWNTNYCPGNGIGYGGYTSSQSSRVNLGTLTAGTDVIIQGSSNNSEWQTLESPFGTRYRYMKAEGPQAEIVPDHTHSFTYTASGSTITATCSADGCTLPPSPEGGSDHVATLTIAAPAHNTYGDGKSAEAIITDENSIRGEATVQYQTMGESGYGDATEIAPTNAGTHKASITVGGATASVEYTIAKIDPIVDAPTGLTATYGQTLANVELPTGWSWVDSSTSVGGAGSRTFKANYTPTDTTNYNSKSNVDVTVTVGKATNPATVTSTASVMRGGKTIDLSHNVALNGATGAVSYAISGEANGCALDGSVLKSGTSAGSVTVNVTVAADENYNALETTQIIVTITEKSTQTITASDVAAIYGDTGKKIEATTTTGGGTLSYAVTSGDAITVDEHTGELTTVNAGSAVVTITASETDDYAEATKDVTVTVNKAASEPAVVNANEWIYDGEEHPLVTEDRALLMSKFAVRKTVSSLYPFELISEEEETESEEIESEAEVAEDELAEDETVEGTDESSDEESTDLSSPELDEETIILNSLVLDDVLTTTESDEESDKKAEEDNKEEESGEEGDEPASEEVSDEVTESDVTEEKAADSSDKFTEEAESSTEDIEETKEAQDITDEKPVVAAKTMLRSVRLLGVSDELELGESEEVGLNYALGENRVTAPSTGWSTAVPTAINAGTYYVWYKVVGDSNHTNTEPQCVTVEVYKAIATITVNDKNIYVGDDIPSLDGSDWYSIANLKGEDTLSIVPTLAYQKDGEAVTPDNSKAGSYDIVASGASAGENYVISYEKGTLKISETAMADAKIVPSDKATSVLPADPEISNGLAEQAEKIAEEDGSKVELKLTVEPKGESTVADSEILNEAPQMKSQVESQFKDEGTVKVDVITIDIKQIINGEDAEDLKALDSVLEIGIGYNFAGKYDPVVVREHGESSQIMKALTERPKSGYVDGTFYADYENNMLYIYSKLFSNYVIAYSTVEGNAANRVATSTTTTTGQAVTVPVYRLFNAQKGYHFFTANAAEKDALVAAGWTDEGIAWQVQPKAGKPVYRLFDKVKGMHIFTADAAERDACIAAGATDEGIAWYGHDTGRIVYKVTNPKVNKVLYTTSAAEKDALAASGFVVEEANFKVN